MAKTRRNRTRRGGQEQSKPSMSIGGKSRRRRGGQYEPAPATTNASNLFEDIGSGAKTAWNKTKEGASWAFNKVFSGAATPNPATQPYAVGGRRKRRGGQVKGYNESFKSVPASVNAKGGSRRKRRGGGEVVSFDENWKEYGSIGGSRRRRRKY
jgi:hypothetical protein